MAVKRIKILLDAGHYGRYNRSPANPKYWESLMAWELHLLLKAELEKYRFIVDVTRRDQTKDVDVYNRGTIAKGYNLLISLHSNATGSARNDNIDYAIVYTLASDSVGKKLADDLATSIASTMKLNQGGRVGTRLQPNGKEYYGILRGAKAVGCPHAFIIEHSFHTAYAPTTWLLEKANLQKLAEIEAAKIAEFYGYAKEDEEMTKEEIQKLVAEEVEKALKASKEKVYHYWKELPKWALRPMYAAYKAKLFVGSSPSNLNVTMAMIRTVVYDARLARLIGVINFKDDAEDETKADILKELGIE